MKTAARWALTVVRVLGIVWFVFFVVLGLIAIATGIEFRRVWTVIAIVAVYGVPGLAAAALATWLRRRLAERPPPRGFEVVTRRPDAGPGGTHT